MERPTWDKPTRIYQLKITLDRSEPERRAGRRGGGCAP
jgi:hypothetical protein